MRKSSISAVRGVLSVVLALTCIGLIFGEIAVRSLTHTDMDGNVYFHSTRLLPYRLPIERIARGREQYERLAHPYIVYVPLTGWTIAPNASASNNSYRSNAAGLRSAPREYALTKAPGSVRLALFGDSFTHGDDVPFADSWGAVLGDTLRTRGTDAEVLNFGVPAYDVGQAYLRWLSEGKRFHPDIVLMGLSSEAIRRTVNIVPAIMYPHVNAFTKPRFYLDGDAMRVVNSPALSPERLAEVIVDFPDIPLAHYEAYYRPAEYTRSPLWRVRLFALLREVMVSGGLPPQVPAARTAPALQPALWPALYDVRGEACQITQRLVAEFQRDVEAAGARFMLAYLPGRSGLGAYARDRSFPAGACVAELERIAPVIHAEVALAAAAIKLESLDAFFAPRRGVSDRYYSARGHRVVADDIATALLSQTQPAAP